MEEHQYKLPITQPCREQHLEKEIRGGLALGYEGSGEIPKPADPTIFLLLFSAIPKLNADNANTKRAMEDIPCGKTAGAERINL